MKPVDEVYHWLRANMQVRAIQHSRGETSWETVETYAEAVLEQIKNLQGMLPILKLPEA